MDVKIVTGNEKVQLSKAILLYEPANSFYHGRAHDQMTYASLHDVVNVGSSTKPNIQIMPGKSLTEDALMSMMGSLADQFITNLEILPENVLSYSPRHIVWWIPAATRNIFINNRELGKRSGPVPHPPLLFVVANGSWYVFALPTNQRPQAATQLCYAPYFNVYESGSICVGSAAAPKLMTIESIASWEAAFFQSEFTHINTSTKTTSHPRGEYALWKDLLDRVYETYPMEYLVSNSGTVANVMKTIASKIGGQ